MQPYRPQTLAEFARQLTTTFAPYHPKTVEDVTDKGVRGVEFILPNPNQPRFAVTVQIREAGGVVDRCSLWFGQAEISGYMNPEQVIPTIEEIIAGRVTALLRYKNQNAYDNHSPSGMQWLYQFTDDEDDDTAAIAQMTARLLTTPTLLERISGKLIGYFEFFSWEKQWTIERK